MWKVLEVLDDALLPVVERTLAEFEPDIVVGPEWLRTQVYGVVFCPDRTTAQSLVSPGERVWKTC